MGIFKIYSLSNFQIYNTVLKVLLFKLEKSDAFFPIIRDYDNSKWSEECFIASFFSLSMSKYSATITE